MNDCGDYVMKQKNGRRCITTSQDKAETFDTLLKATNVNKCLPSSITRRSKFFPVCIDEEPDMEMKTVSSISDAISNINNSINEIINNKEFYIKKLSEVDQDVCDIYHYIELSKLNASDGYKAYKMLHDKLQERREIKNTLVEIDMLTSLGKKTKKAKTRIDGIVNRKYKPRRLDYLFETEKLKGGIR